MYITEFQISPCKNEVSQLPKMTAEIHPLIDAVARMETAITAIQQIQEGFGEISLMVQTLQATSYSGTFIWKISEVQRRRELARSGRTISLHSSPFYTSHHGYKMCLRLYLNGDGSGKGTHLSFFFVLMRGEYDDILTWPFRQVVTLTLLNQDKQKKDIVRTIKPRTSSSSFQRPTNEMNVASGCPQFAPLSIFDDDSYVKNDMIFIKVDTSGISIPP